jgi:hypothetical protein
MMWDRPDSLLLALMLGRHLGNVVADLLDHPGVLLVQVAEQRHTFGGVRLFGVLDVLLLTLPTPEGGGFSVRHPQPRQAGSYAGSLSVSPRRLPGGAYAQALIADVAGREQVPLMPSAALD